MPAAVAPAETATESERHRALAVGRERLQILGDGALAGLIDLLLADDLHRRRRLDVGPADVRARDLDAFQRLPRRRRGLREGKRPGAQQNTAARDHQPRAELRLSQHDFPR